MVMDHGRVIADDDASTLKTRLAGDVITLGFGSAADATTAARSIETVGAASVSGSTITLTVEHGERILPTLLRDLDGVTTATLRQPTLDDVFLALTGRSLRDDSLTNESSKEEVNA
jgi:ABC-2 type transport system ATP-binding protein